MFCVPSNPEPIKLEGKRMTTITKASKAVQEKCWMQFLGTEQRFIFGDTDSVHNFFFVGFTRVDLQPCGSVCNWREYLYSTRVRNSEIFVPLIDCVCMFLYDFALELCACVMAWHGVQPGCGLVGVQ